MRNKKNIVIFGWKKNYHIVSLEGNVGHRNVDSRMYEQWRPRRAYAATQYDWWHCIKLYRILEYRTQITMANKKALDCTGVSASSLLTFVLWTFFSLKRPHIALISRLIEYRNCRYGKYSGKYFSYFSTKNVFWVLTGTASLRQFQLVHPELTFLWANKKKKRILFGWEKNYLEL